MKVKIMVEFETVEESLKYISTLKNVESIVENVDKNTYVAGKDKTRLQKIMKEAIKRKGSKESVRILRKYVGQNGCFNDVKTDDLEMLINDLLL